VIRNIGSSVLYLTGDPMVELLYTNVNAVTSMGATIDTSQTVTTIQPGSHTTFTVNYVAQGATPKTYCSILIRSSDVSKEPFYFYVYRSARELMRQGYTTEQIEAKLREDFRDQG
jgi:hypothetical protein